MKIVHCPKCGAKIDEIPDDQLKEGKVFKKYCRDCKLEFWIVVDVQLRQLIKTEDIKKINKGN